MAEEAETFKAGVAAGGGGSWQWWRQATVAAGSGRSGQWGSGRPPSFRVLLHRGSHHACVVLRAASSASRRVVLHTVQCCAPCSAAHRTVLHTV